MWGTPRLISTALALAFCAVSNPQVAVTLYRAQSERLVPTDLSRAATLNEHLLQLESDADVSEALPALARQLPETQSGAEAVIITSEAARYDADFLQALRQSGPRSGWLISVSRNHRVQFWRIDPHALVAVRELHIDLNDILSPSTTAAPLRKTSFEDLPAYCRLANPPLRVSHTYSVDTAWEAPGRGILAISQDGRLTFRDQANLGPVELARNLPLGRVLWTDTQPETPHRAVIGRLSRRGIYLLRVWFESGQVDVRSIALDALPLLKEVPTDGHEQATLEVPMTDASSTGDVAWDDLFPERRSAAVHVMEPNQVSSDGTFIYVHLPGGLCVCNGAGERICTALIPIRFRALRGRFFQERPTGRIYAACCDGTRVVFRGCSGDLAVNQDVLCVVTPSANPEHAVALTASAQLIDLTTLESRPITGNNFQLAQIRTVLAVSRDHGRIAVGTSSGAACTIDVTSATATSNSQGRSKAWKRLCWTPSVGGRGCLNTISIEWESDTATDSA